MSLVNYSSDEEEEEGKADGRQQQARVSASSSSEPSSAHASSSDGARRVERGFTTQSCIVQKTSLATSQVSFSSSVVETSLKLPDASQLFSSFDSVKGNVVMNVAGTEFSSKRRSDLNGSANAPPKKIPKGSLMPVRIAPDTAGGSLLPPQLRGRSNVATEDLDKLFTRKSKRSVEFEPQPN